MTDGKTTSKEKSEVTKIVSLPKKFKIGEKIVYIASKPIGVLEIIGERVLVLMGKLGDERLSAVRDMKSPKDAVPLLLEVYHEGFDEFYELMQLLVEPAANIEQCKGEINWDNMETNKDDFRWRLTSTEVAQMLLSFIDEHKPFGEALKNVSALRIV